MGGFLYVLSSVAVMAEVSIEIILPVEDVDVGIVVLKPSEPLSKTEITVVVEVEERMRGICWNAKAETVGKLTRVKSEALPFKRQMIEPSL